MKTALRSLLLLPLAALIACGTSAPAVGGIAPISGDYVLNVNPVAGGAATSFSGNLYISGTGVSGSFVYGNGNSACNAQSFPVTGTINTAGTLMTLSSSAFAGSLSGNTVSLTLQLPLITYSDYTYNTTGTAQIAAGSTGTNCALASSPLTAQYLPPFTGSGTGAVSGPSRAQRRSSSAETIPQTLATSTSARRPSSPPPGPLLRRFHLWFYLAHRTLRPGRRLHPSTESNCLRAAEPGHRLRQRDHIAHHLQLSHPKFGFGNLPGSLLLRHYHPAVARAPSSAEQSPRSSTPSGVFFRLRWPRCARRVPHPSRTLRWVGDR